MLKWFALGVAVLCTACCVQRMVEGNYVMALVDLVLVLINVNTYVSARARELVKKPESYEDKP